MIREKNPNFKGLWAKYDKYEIVNINDEFYIKPVKNSDYIIFDVFEKQKELLVDFLMIGKEALEYSDINDAECVIMATETKYQKMVLDFVNKYGLMGKLTYDLLNTHILTSGKVFTQVFSNVTELSASTYIKPYFIGNEDIQRIDFDHGINEDILKYVFGSENPNGDIKYNFQKNEEYSLVFSNEYREKISTILILARLMYRMFNSVENACWSEDNNKKLAYQKFSSRFSPNNIALNFEFEENKTLLAWDFNSLLQAIELIFAFNQTNDRKEVKMCKHCNKPFIAKNLNAEYDTASCRNMANVYRNRAKNKNK